NARVKHETDSPSPDIERGNVTGIHFCIRQAYSDIMPAEPLRIAVRGHDWRLIFPPLIRLVIAVAPLLRLLSPAGAAESKKPAEDTALQARAKVLIERMLKEREKIVSARVHVIGSRNLGPEDPSPVRSIRGSYAFDHSKGLFRFDGSRPLHVRVINA